MRIGNCVFAGVALGLPLVCACGTLGQFPLVAEEIFEEVVVPLGRRLGPDDFKTAGDGVGADAGAEAVLPAESHLLKARALGLGDQRGLQDAAPCVLPKVWPPAMSATVSSSFMAMRAKVSRMSRARACGIRIAVGAFGVHVDQAHLHRGKRIGEFAIAAVALVAEPLGLRTPVGVDFRLPDVGATAAEAEGLEAHRLERDVAGEDHEIGPGNFAAVLLLDGPEQAARLVEVDVVGPAVERRESLRAASGAAASVVDAVGSGGVPGHADEERAVVAEVGGPPILRIGHDGMEILDHGIEVKFLELLRVIELLFHRIGERGVLMKNAEIQLIGPPVAVASASADVAIAVENGHFASLDMISPVVVCCFERV